MNKLYYGDCLEVLKNSIQDESIDLIYIDPPFNSKRDYNVLFESIDLTDAKAQKQAFADTWSKVVYYEELNQIMDLDRDLHKYLKTLDELPLPKGVVSYLTIMAHRIWYMRRKLTDCGSFYLHCDPTMSHYLKIVCDLIFGNNKFRNEIVWKKIRVDKAQSKHFAKLQDTIFYYSKSDNYIFHQYYHEPSQDYIDKYYTQIETETGRRYQLISFLQGGQGPARYFGDRIIEPPKGRHWIWDQEKIDCAYNENRLVFTHPDKPRLKRYLDEYKGRNIGTIWDDIPPVNSQAKEALGYPTKKPEALMERIINTSTNKNSVVADFFCGCGTTIATAHKLKRKWIGVDISHLAVRLVYDRLLSPYEGKYKALDKVTKSIEINGFPKDIASAKDLAEKTDKSRMKFQDWVVEIMMKGVSNPKKVGDGGYDGYITFNKSEKEKDVILIEVKSGKCGVGKLRSFITTIQQENGDFGAFVCFKENVTSEMEKLAKQQGSYKPELWGNKFDKVQIITIEELLVGKSVQYPIYQNITFKAASNIPITKEDNNHSLFK